jgi:hypothetical protein
MSGAEPGREKEMARNSGTMRGTGNWVRYLGFGTTATVLSVAALMVLLPVAAATSSSPMLSIPVKNLGATVSSDTTKGACGVAKLTKSPSWSKAKSLFRASSSSITPACGHQSAPNEAESTGALDLQNSDVKFPTSGSFVLNVSWTMKVNETWSMNPYSSCKVNYAVSTSMCMTYAEDTVYAYVMMYDLSNSSWGQYGYGYSFGTFIDLYLNTFAYVENESCVGCNYSYGTPGSGSFVGTLNENNLLNLTGTSVINSHDHYEISIYLEVSTLAFAYSVSAKTTGTASASATINAGSSGNGIKLNSIIVS